MLSTVGLIPARGGSKGVINKNLREVNGIPLIAHTIIAAEKSIIERVLVLTDSPAIQKVAVEFGAECPILRPKETATDSAHMFLVYKFAMKYLQSRNATPHSFCAMLPTTPLRTVDQINNSVLKIQTGEFDWVFTVNEMEHHPYRAMKVLDSHHITPFHGVDAKIMWANRQELPRVVRFNGGTICGLAEHALNNDEYNIDGLNSYNTKVGFVEVSQEEAYDIDSEFDISVVENYLARRNNV